MIKIALNKPIKDLYGNAIIKKRDDSTSKITVRDYFIVILMTNFETKNEKEVFWSTELGILFSDTDKDEVEISEEKAKFLKRIIKEGKSQIRDEQGVIKEISTFKPYETSQLLRELMTEGELKEIMDAN